MSNVPQSVHTVCDEARAFRARHPLLNATQQSLGMLTFGLLRAVAECPDCPGVFRASPDDWQTLICPQCHGVWKYQGEATPHTDHKPPKRRKKGAPNAIPSS